MLILISERALAAGVPWMPSAFKASPACDLKVFWLLCSSSSFTGHPSPLHLQSQPCYELDSILLFVLYYCHGISLLNSAVIVLVLLWIFFFFFIHLWVLFIFITNPKEYVFVLRFPGSQSLPWSHGLRMGKLVLFFWSPCFIGHYILRARLGLDPSHFFHLSWV